MSNLHDAISQELEERKRTWYKLITPEHYDEMLARAVEGVGGHLMDINKFEHGKAEDGIYTCTSPVTIAFYHRESDNKACSKAITMRSESTRRVLLPELAAPEKVREVRLEHIRKVLQEWPDVGVAFTYQLDSMEEHMLRGRPVMDAQKLEVYVRYGLVEGYVPGPQQEELAG